MFEQASIIGSIPARWPLHPAYMHTFGITNNYFVIVEQPLSVSVPAVVRSHLLNEPLIANFKWYQDQQVSFRCVNILSVSEGMKTNLIKLGFPLSHAIKILFVVLNVGKFHTVITVHFYESN
jgi:hypothetical protein